MIKTRDAGPHDLGDWISELEERIENIERKIKKCVIVPKNQAKDMRVRAKKIVKIKKERGGENV